MFVDFTNRFLTRFASAAAFAAAISLCCSAVADAGTAPGVEGVVTSADGAHVAGAVVTLQGHGTNVAAKTDAAGAFTFAGVAPGVYLLRTTASRFDPLVGRTIAVHAGSVTELRLSLARSSSSLATIGRVQVSGSDALSTSSAPVTYLDSQQYSEAGYTRLSDVLQNNISTTLVHPAGGGSSVLPTSVALRGPDPTETLDDIDGFQVNNGNTGDFDLSLLDPADFVGVELVKGISPSSLVGPDTIDGAINIRTLEPTTNPHGLARFTVGSFGSYAETLDSTGSAGRLGYAFSLHRTTTAGEVNQTVLDVSGNTPTLAHVGSGMDSSTALAKLRYAFGRGDGYAEFSFHDQSATRDLSAALTSYVAPAGDTEGDEAARRRSDADDSGDASSPAAFDGFEGTSLLTHNAGYGVDVSVPVGGRDADGASETTAVYRHSTSIVNESVRGPGADTSPYLYGNRDLIGDDILSLDHRFYNSDLTLQYEVRNETLATDFLPGVVNDESIARGGFGTASTARKRFDDDGGDSSGISTLNLGQTQRSAVLRYSYDPSAKLHITAAGYFSDYSIFGTSLDPRFGVVYTPDARTAIRASIGTTYQAPQLPELLPVPDILPPAVGGVISVGNPNLQPDRATEYGFGFDHVFETGDRRTTFSADLYQVNLRDPAATLQPDCDAPGAVVPACELSYTINAGDGRYRGFELQGTRRIAPFTSVNLGYAVRSAYLTAIPANTQDGTLILGEQAQGLPLQKATAQISKEPPLGFRYGGGFVYEGLDNELNRPQFATFDARLGYRWKQLELEVSGTNLTNVYDQHFTQTGLGVPYGVVGGLTSTDAYSIQGTAISASITHRF